MNENQRAALLMSQSIACLVEAMGMFSTNMQRAQHNQSMAYEDDAFIQLAESHGIGYNQAILTLRGE